MANNKKVFCGGVTGTSAPVTRKATLIMNKKALRPIERGDCGSLTTALGIAVGEFGYAIDNGTGASNVALFLGHKGVKTVRVLQTHLHDDHVQGITGNKHWMRKGYIDGIYAPKIGRGFETVFGEKFSPESWPVSPAMFGAKHRFIDIVPGESIVDLPQVKTLALNHPGGCVGYRIPTLDGDVVITTDVELARPEDKEAWQKFVRGAALVYVDVQYRDDEYLGKIGIGTGPAIPRAGWGHSTPSMVLECLKGMTERPFKVLIGHHDPDRDEKDLFHFEKEMQDLLGEYTQVEFAREGCEY